MLKVVVTVDVENPQTDFREGRVSANLVDPLVDNDHHGVSKITEILDKNCIKGVFFITTSEKHIFGENFYRSLCQDLCAQGHEVAIHSHPEWVTNDGRVHMWQFSYTEQLSMLREMEEDITNWVGKSPVSHRAGAYGVNDDTFAALDELGIKVDSSIFAEHENCKVQLCFNHPINIRSITEVPVTGFYKILRLSIGPMKLHLRRTFVKTDIEACSLEELKWFVDYALRNNLEVLNLFMHSYSLLNLKNLPEISKNENDEKLESFFSFLNARESVSFSTLEELADSFSERSDLTQPETVPTFFANISIFEFLVIIKRKLGID